MADMNMGGEMGEKKANGAVIGTIVVIIVLLAGAWYMWHSGKVDTGVDENGVETQVGDLDNADSEESSLNQQSDSDDINSIETDVNASSYDSI